MKPGIFKLNRAFALESGQSLSSPTIYYHTAGEINAERDNIVWVFHALTANSNVFEWWPGLFGDSDLFNANDHFIICVNTLGSPYGSTSAEDLDFPHFTVRDVVNLQLELANHLGIKQINTLIGGSFGGYQAIEFAYSFSGKIQHFISVASSAKASPWSIAIHESQRLAIEADPTFGEKGGGKSGLKAARAIGMLTYRTPESFIQTQDDKPENWLNHRASSYVDYQGTKLVNRFNALSYHYLTRCLDSHHLGRSRGGLVKALQQLKMKTLVISIDSDKLELPAFQREMAEHIPNATLNTIQSDWGHDGFLIETKKITEIIKPFISKSDD